MHDGTVLVTGASGFIAMHCIVALLQQGYRVRGSVRDLARADSIRATLARHAPAATSIEFVAADLSSDAGWAEAMAGVQYVLHVASPLPKKASADADAVIATARDGALRVLRAASAARVRRVVMTSSVAAVLYGHARDGSRVYDESDWTDLDGDVAVYERSKTIAERAAWDFVAALPPDASIEFCTINPGLVLGPLLGPDYSTSGELVRKLLARELPGCPDVGWATVDVRDVARAHVSALSAPGAPGHRFIVAIGHTTMLDVARILHERFASEGFPVRLMRVPDWVLRVAAVWDDTVRLAVPELGKRQDVSSQLARDVLGWTARPLPEMVIAMAESMIAQGIVRPTRRKTSRKQHSAAPLP